MKTILAELKKIIADIKLPDNLPITEFAWIPYKSYKVIPVFNKNKLDVYRKNKKLYELFVGKIPSNSHVDIAYVDTVEDVSPDYIYPPKLDKWKIHDIKILLDDLEKWY